MALLVALVPLLPLLVVASSLFHPEPEIWEHLRQHVLPELLWNTLWLVLGVGIGVTLLGVTLAWLTTACDYPGRRFYAWALLLPLALPAYVTAFVWLGLLDFSGTLPAFLRAQFGLAWAPPIRSRGGVILVMSLALYPYVYLVARSAFHGQGARLMEAAQSLGLSRRRAFFHVALPMARPGIAAGIALALMEALADFGTVAIFNYNTFTTAIYKAWFSLFSLPAAAQLAALLTCVVLFAVLVESSMRSRRDYSAPVRGVPARRINLTGWQGVAAAVGSALVLLLAFAIPAGHMLLWAVANAGRDIDARYFDFAWHSLMLAGLGAGLVVALALALGYAQRLDGRPAMRALARFASIGYALPGGVLAVGIFIPVAWLDNRLIDWFKSDGQWLSGTLLVMLLAYCARFLAVGFGPIETGLIRISKTMDEAAQSLGVIGGRRLWKVHLPLLRVPLLTAAALCFVDIMKELPITLMTRPFGWDTLAVRVFEMTSEGEWERAALPALLIVLVGLIPVAYLIRSTDHARP